MRANDIVPTKKPRNFVAKNATTGGAGQHKDRKKAAKQGDVKHKNKTVAEGWKEAEQLRIDVDGWVGVENTPEGVLIYGDDLRFNEDTATLTFIYNLTTGKTIEDHVSTHNDHDVDYSDVELVINDIVHDVKKYYGTNWQEIDDELHGGLSTEEGVAEAGSRAQQAAIAINMKKHHKKPKNEDQGVAEGEGDVNRVEYWGYAYNRRDQRVMWSKIFDSEQQAQQWIDEKNATPLGSRPVEQTPAMENDFKSMMDKITAPSALNTREALAMISDLVDQGGASYEQALDQASISYEINPVKLDKLYNQQHTDMQEATSDDSYMIVTELTKTLARYKTAASADASAADAKGDYQRGNKRFKGIVKATIKQGENDAKKSAEKSKQ